MSSALHDLIKQFNSHASGVNGEAINETTRTRLLEFASKLVVALQKPEDVLYKIAYSPSQFMAIRTLTDLNVWNIIGEKGPITSEELAKETGADVILLERLLRVLIAAGIVGEVGASTYAPTALTETLRKRTTVGMVQFIYDLGLPTLITIPEFLKSTAYRNPTRQDAGPFQYKHQIDHNMFDWLLTRPDDLNKTQTFFEGDRGSRPDWIDWFPVEEKLLSPVKNSLTPNEFFFVDVAGGRGHEISSFYKKFKEYPGRFVLQDQSVVLADDLKLDPAIEKVPFNFFEDNVVQGSRFYYTKFIFHDWSDEKSLEILQHITPSMVKGHSKLIIEDFLIPDTNCPLLPAMWDMEMMTFLSGMERSVAQWKRLLGEAGLEIEGFYPPPGDGTGIIVTKLKE